MGIEGASEILQESGCVMGGKSGVAKKRGGKDKIVARKDAQVMGEGSEDVLQSSVVGEGSETVGEGSEGVGEGSVEGKHGHVSEECIEERKAYVIQGESEIGEGSV